MPRKVWSDEIKAMAAADLLAGMTVREVAAKYGMPRSTAGALTRTSKPGAVYVQKVLDINDWRARFAVTLDGCLGALDAMTGHIKTETKHAVEHGDKLGVLFGVVVDKTGKIAGATMDGPGLHPAMDSGPAHLITSAPGAGPVDPDDQGTTPETGDIYQ
jgi:hypothetical protein